MFILNACFFVFANVVSSVMFYDLGFLNGDSAAYNLFIYLFIHLLLK